MTTLRATDGCQHLTITCHTYVLEKLFLFKNNLFYKIIICFENACISNGVVDEACFDMQQIVTSNTCDYLSAAHTLGNDPVLDRYLRSGMVVCGYYRIQSGMRRQYPSTQITKVFRLALIVHGLWRYHLCHTISIHKYNCQRAPRFYRTGRSAYGCTAAVAEPMMRWANRPICIHGFATHDAHSPTSRSRASLVP